MKNLLTKNYRTMQLLILGAVLLGLGIFPAVAQAQPSVTNAPGSVDRSTVGNFTLNVSLGAAPADSVCQIVLTPNAALTSLGAVAPVGWSVVVGATTITWTSVSTPDCLFPLESENFTWNATAPANGGDYSVAWDLNGGSSSGNFNVHVNQPNFTTSTKTV
ncbi:MAG: hypothetical protein HKN21_00310, partial [Candidatus Eisenbacteria bacterium]|nr:hypothetical protein [Candidatus Eisenbacteria bacterium]